MTIELNGLSKTVGSKLILNDIDLVLEDHKIYGLLGQNDSGKSSLMKVIMNVLLPSEGHVLIEGETGADRPEKLKQLYFLTQDDIYPKRARVKDLVRWMASFYKEFDTANCKRLLDTYHLDENRRYYSLSQKEKSLVKSSLAFSVDVDYLLLDEPGYGLDAYHRHAIYDDLLASCKRHPKTVVLASHVIDEITAFLDEVIILEDGQILVHDSVERLANQAVLVCGAERPVRDYLQGKEILGQEYDDGFIEAVILTGEDVADAAEELTLSRLNLQELFIQLTRDVRQAGGAGNENE